MDFKKSKCSILLNYHLLSTVNWHSISSPRSVQWCSGSGNSRSRLERRIQPVELPSVEHC